MKRPRRPSADAPGQPAATAPFDAPGVLGGVTGEVAFALFDQLPDTFLFVKDRAGRFVRVNTALWRLHGCRDAGGMLGRTDFDFHPPALAAQYVAEDGEVMHARRPLLDRPWLVPGADGVPLWYQSSKLPLVDTTGAVVGIAGVMRPSAHAGSAPAAYVRLAPALEAVLSGYGRPLTIAGLARRAHLSLSQFQREFRRLLHLTPSDYLLRVRMLMARRRLERSADPVGAIALDTGFYDQSHFTRAFRRHTGMTPLAYRRCFAPRD
jgi:AraC-like DNA-binding protein